MIMDKSALVLIGNVQTMDTFVTHIWPYFCQNGCLIQAKLIMPNLTRSMENPILIALTYPGDDIHKVLENSLRPAAKKIFELMMNDRTAHLECGDIPLEMDTGTTIRFILDSAPVYVTLIGEFDNSNTASQVFDSVANHYLFGHLKQRKKNHAEYKKRFVKQ
jgi:hypothetical protein